MTGRRARTWRERGSASLEFLGVLPILLLIALAGIQLGFVAYAANQAGTAARTAARTAALRAPHPDAGEAGRNAVSDWLRDGTVISPASDDGDSVTMTATINIPSVIPGVSIFGPVRRSATMPKEDTTP
ncbi:pilus assembly protein [Streptomyces sp. So13.3]|uniref:TadE/TadG family type IV pilus assembly protein n=1 Tax=Streptomyces TaxID=1883 RepID=UPI001106E296|nr:MULTISPECIES: TadE/TadG family type IV pilus assembly protein [Streptomyces]MCZ4100846.1 pilus assembly protein [Streptomyces sp. H39-C1]QNA75041.1 pilus assembly protein [Streptomyces sp. So13.3]